MMKPPLRYPQCLVIFLLALALAVPASAQTTTGRLQGIVRDAGGVVAGATVKTVAVETGLTRGAVTAADGSYAVVLPPGVWVVTISTPAHLEHQSTVRLGVGQVLDENATLTAGTRVKETISVSATAIAPEVEMRTAEVATNVSREQISALPQSSRNFLNAAVLAPGIRLSHDELRQEYSYGAQGAVNTNVFIDGTSFKNDILQGGNVGQDSSRGNPFPQNAVEEFRVITQNYKAEYQKSSSAIISAITKSGSNDYHGEAFLYYQNKALVAQDKFSARAGLDKPEYTRYQPGLSLGGPIAKDNVFFFASYEGNYQNRENSVLLGNDSNWPSAFRQQFQKYVGNYMSPFRESLAFGKVTALLGTGSTLDVSGDWRHETDIRDFGNQTSYDSATNIKNDIASVRAKHTAIFSNFLNEATLAYQSYAWNPVPVDNSLVGQNFDGLMHTGSKDTIQDFTQKRLSIRDDLTLMNVQAAGEHVVKFGANFDHLTYHVIKSLNGVPTFNYRSATYATTPGDMPYNAVYGVGNPDMSTNNNQFGIYLQDDWRVTSRLTVNVGVRWDFETDMLNNNYVTPASIVSGLSSVYPSNYFTDGSQRPTYYGAIQPRIGVSYDVLGDGRTVAYAGYGKYYDRTLYNDILDEKFRQQWQIRTFWFSKDGSPQDGNPAIKWDPSYLSQAALDKLIASGAAPQPEIFLLSNDTRPPSSDQWSAGVRHNFGIFTASAGYAGTYSKNQLTWTCGIKNADGSCDWGARPSPNLGFSMLSRGKEGWYNSFQLQIQKPYTTSSHWSGSLSYVYGDAKQTGNDLFSWGKLDPVYGVQQRSPIAQKHQITAFAMVGLPAGFQASTLITLGSGYPFFSTDCSQGYDKCTDLVGGGDPPKWTQSVDLRLEWGHAIASSVHLTLVGEVINVFNYSNEQGYDGWIPALPDVNTNYGQASSAYNPRRIQFGAKIGF